MKQLFKLEKAQPGVVPPVEVTKQQAAELAKKAEIGDSFYVPYKQWQTVKKMLASDMPKRRFVYSIMKDEKPMPLTKVTRSA